MHVGRKARRDHLARIRFRDARRAGPDPAGPDRAAAAFTFFFTSAGAPPGAFSTFSRGSSAIFGRDGKPVQRRIERWPLRDGPGEQDALPLEAKIVVEMRGLVLLNDIGELSARRALRLGLARRFGRGVKTSFLFVFLEAHGISLSASIFSSV